MSRRRFRGGINLVTLLAGSAIILVLMPVVTRSIAAGDKPAQIVVKMQDMPLTFDPSVVRIKAGQTVEWENVGNEVHHATSDPDLAINASEVKNPPGVAPFDSGFLRPGETFTHTFTVSGEYKYACVVHEAKGMIGTIIVDK